MFLVGKIAVQTRGCVRPLTAGTLPRGAGRVIPALVHLGASLVQEPPPRGDLSGGIWSAPAWIIGGLGGFIVLGAVAAVVGRAIFLRRRREREDRAPGPAAGGDVKKLVRRLIVALLFAVAVYGAIILYRGASSIAAAFETFAWWTFAAGCGLAFSNYVLRFLKWEYYLATLEIRGVPKGQSFLIFLSGFVLTITPGKVGEVFKSLILNQLRKVPIARTAPIIVAERVTDLIGVIVMIAVGSLGFTGGMIWASAGAALVVGLLVFVASERLSGAVLRRLPGLPGPLGRAGKVVAPKVEEGLVGLRVLTTPARLVVPTILSIAAWSLEGIAAWVILGGFGQRTPLPQTAFFYATATLAGALVPVPGGLGVTDKLLEEQLALLGHVPSATASAAMLLTRFATLWFAVAVGFVALAILRALHPELGDPDPAGTAGEASPEKTP